MHVVIFEGSMWPTFAPLALSRPVFTLMSGMTTLLEKQVRHLAPTRLTLWVRPELEEHCRVRLVPNLPVPTQINTPLDDEPALLVSGRMVLLSPFEVPSGPAVVTEETDIVRFASVTSPGLGPSDMINRTDRWLGLLNLPQVTPQGRLVQTPWDLIHWNEESIIGDVVPLKQRPTPHPAGPYHMVREEDVWLGDEVKLDPGCVLDASKGPVVLANHVSVGANAVLQGPCYIGPYSRITPLSLIRPATSIGPMCRIGGEVSNSIILGYSNKAHDGFLGDSYLGKWVNFGAATTTSNLKNTYGEVTVLQGKREIATGRRFLGALVGDHCKTAIQTRLGAGAYVGFCSSLAGSNVAPRCVPSFTFWTDKGAEPYRMDKAKEVISQVFSRRDRAWTESDERVVRYVAKVAPTVEC